VGCGVIGELHAPKQVDAMMFALQISITLAAVNQLKADLTKALPAVKSSHRVEALARGTGFRTYASMLAAGALPGAIGTVDGASFTRYLDSRGFNVEAPLFYRVVARTAVRSVLRTVPVLTAAGIGIGPPRQNAEGKWETSRERNARFLEWQRELLEAEEEFLLALAFVSQIPKIKTARSGRGSYRLKHIAENYACTYPTGEKLGPRYVSNGALIAASVHAGFNFKKHVDQLGYDNLNVTFNMSKKSTDELDRMIRRMV
jgi:hypothetical protein